MNRIYEYLPELTGEEFYQVEQITKALDEDEFRAFANIYKARRKDPQMVMILSLVGLFVLPGLQRFYTDQIGMGILYLFTLGLCFIGSILDLVNYKKLTMEFNAKVISESYGIAKGN